ncbi:hypothetical protein O6H91_03G132300 [Diphasiastrum complanatum]|uniref:Uncharacterized protein n=2 Tax=Diphasiastrum complanatum TaxID=34168 RepID=A0ACC2EBH9_DIPCM|nr:hypothetical protein O6H91_03G132300 [Diphasiastrum complanatum]KAJ7563970.1 hypothetical protein O6H91_03G132300 [Diphasiastrum complanatum]
MQLPASHGLQRLRMRQKKYYWRLQLLICLITLKSLVCCTRSASDSIPEPPSISAGGTETDRAAELAHKNCSNRGKDLHVVPSGPNAVGNSVPGKGWIRRSPPAAF